MVAPWRDGESGVAKWLQEQCRREFWTPGRTTLRREGEDEDLSATNHKIPQQADDDYNGSKTAEPAD